MSEILSFYRNESVPCGGFFTDIVNRWSDQHWEQSHDFIQWLFPLKTPSNFNPDAPLLTDDDVEQFVKCKDLEGNVFQAFIRCMKFLGLNGRLVWRDVHEHSTNEWAVSKADNFAEREEVWSKINHNWLRITRVMASLRLLKYDPLADAFFKCLCDLYNEGYGSAESFSYWQKASEGLIQ